MKNKFKLIVLMLAAANILVLPLNCGAWKSREDKYAPMYQSSSSNKGSSEVVEKGVTPIFINAPISHRIPGIINIKLNGEYEYFYNTPIVINDRVFLPFRELFELLNMKVEWIDEENKAIATSENKKIEIVLNSNNATVDGNEVYVDVPAQIVNDKTYVPVRFVAENTNYDVSWDQSEETVIIKSKVGV